MAVKSRDNLFDKPLKMLDLLRNAKWENSFLSKIALFTHSLKKVIPTFKEILSVSKTKNWCLLQNIIPTFLLKTFEFISFIIKGRDNKKVVITTRFCLLGRIPNPLESPLTTYNTAQGGFDEVLKNFFKKFSLFPTTMKIRKCQRNTEEMLLLLLKTIKNYFEYALCQY